MYIDLVVFLVGNAKQKWTPLTNPWDSKRCWLSEREHYDLLACSAIVVTAFEERHLEIVHSYL